MKMPTGEATMKQSKLSLWLKVGLLQTPQGKGLTLGDLKRRTTGCSRDVQGIPFTTRYYLYP